MILLIVDLCVFHLMYNCLLTLKLSQDVLANDQWDVSKTDIHICFLHRFVEDCGEADVFLSLTFSHQYVDWIQFDHTKVFLLIVVCISHRS